MTVLFESASAVEPGPPVWREADRAWLLTRHADVQSLLRAPHAQVIEFQSGIETIGRRAGRDYGSLVRLLSGILFFRNPPWHSRARASLRRSLGAIGARMTETELIPIVEAAVSSVVGRGPAPVDAVPHLADRIPVLVMAHLLGLSETTVDTIHKQGKGVVNAWHRAMPLRAYDSLQRQSAEIDAAIGQDIRRARLDGGPLGTFLDGDAFDEGEVIGLVFGIIMAGIETTSGLLASVLYAVAVTSAGTDSADGVEHLERGFVEEVMRMAPPVRTPSARRLDASHQFGDVMLEAGSLVSVDIRAAQRDPAVYADPHRFEPRRVSPPLLAFGSGIHACLGSQLATLEARLLFRSALRLDLELPDNRDVEWDPDPTFCRLQRLDIRLNPIKKQETLPC